MTVDSISIIILHCADTLPPVAAERIMLLRALSHIVSVNHKAWPIIESLLAAAEATEKLQKELPLQLNPTHNHH